MSAPVRRSPLALAVLALLRNGPMHPYQMQVLIREWAKDQVVNVQQRTSLYRTIERLHSGGLVSVHATERDQQRPERTVYAITPAGAAQVLTWLSDMLATPAREFPEFPAAVSFLVLLPPEGVQEALERRRAALAADLARYAADQAEADGMGVPRVFLLEVELVRAVTVAELDWVDNVLADLRSGALHWSEEWLQEMGRQFDERLGDDVLSP